jgi:hypothetical protein
MIRELNSVVYKGIENKTVPLPGIIWLDEIGGRLSGLISFNDTEHGFVSVDLLNNPALTICTEQELFNMLNTYSISNYDILRLEVRETNKWGRKPLFVNGTNGVCFSACTLNVESDIFLVLYATSGTRGIESIYLHGIWKL